MLSFFRRSKPTRSTPQRVPSWKPRLEVLEDRTVPTTLNPGDILVVDRATSGVIRVDPTTGTQTMISSGNNFTHAADIAIDGSGDLFAAGFSAGHIIRVDVATGAEMAVSAGGSFLVPWGIAVDPAGNLLVADLAAFGGNGGIIRVDPTTGGQTTVSSGNNFVEPARLTIDAAGNLLVSDPDAFGGGGIIRVDPTTGAQTVVSSGGFFVQPAGITTDAAGNILVADISAFGGNGGIIRVDPLTGIQTMVSSFGSSFLVSPHGIAIDPGGNIIVVMPQDRFGGGGGIMRVDPLTGTQTVVSSGGSFIDPTGIVIVPGSECVPAPAGLVAWYSGEGDASDQTGQHNGTPINGVSYAPGKVGQAFHLDGIDDYIRVPHDPALNPRDGLTIEAWIKSESTAGPRVIASKWNDNTSDWSYIFKDWNSTDTLSIELSRSVHSDLAGLVGATSIPLGSWVHVAATFDGSTVRLYFNGTLDGSLSVGPELIDTSLTDFLIGSGPGENFAGLIDELTVYNRALSLAEIDSIFRAGSAGKCLNQAPTASSGGPYSVIYADSVTLDASGSSDPDGDALTYSWTINGHAAAAAGVQPTLTWSQLQSLGITPGTAYAVSVTVDDGHGHVVSSTDALLSVNNRDLHVSATGINKTYDGTTVASVTLSDDRVSGDQLTIGYTAAAFADPNAGSGKPVSISGITISGADAGNYHLVSAAASTTADITRATPTFSLVTPPVIVTGTATGNLSGTIRAGSLVPPGDVTITINGVSRNAPIDAGGCFSAVFPTAALRPGSYPIDYAYPGSTNFADTHATATLNVTYRIRPRFDRTVPRKAGSTIPIQLALLDAADRNVSSPAVRIRALGIAPLSNSDNLMPAEDAGNSNPGNFFRFQGGANPFYQFNLKTPKCRAPGAYLLFFEVEGDPIRHSVQFTIK